MELIAIGSVGGREDRLDGLSFWSQASSSETATCNTLIFWAWVIVSPAIHVDTLIKKG